MRTEPIEKALRELPAPEPPADLKARCLATIPESPPGARASLTPVRPARRPWPRIIGLRAAVAGALVMAITLGVSRFRSTQVSGDAVFAASLEAMRKVTFYHVKDRDIGNWPEGGSKQGDGWYWGPWIHGETWFDAEHGLVSALGSTTRVRQMSLGLPDGRLFMRLFSDAKPENNLRITDFGPKGWVRQRSLEAKQFTDLRPMAGGVNWEGTPRVISTVDGHWKGRRAIVITYLTPPIPAKAARGAPTVRTEFYIDPATHLCMALRSYSRPPRRPEWLVREAQFDFSRRPDRSLFDPTRLTRGANHITRQKGRPGIVVSPEEWIP